MTLIRLTRYERATANPGRPVWVNPDLIATVERYSFGDEYTRIELAGGTILKVTEQPERILEEQHYAALEVAVP